MSASPTLCGRTIPTGHPIKSSPNITRHQRFQFIARSKIWRGWGKPFSDRRYGWIPYHQSQERDRIYAPRRHQDGTLWIIRKWVMMFLIGEFLKLGATQKIWVSTSPTLNSFEISLAHRSANRDVLSPISWVVLWIMWSSKGLLTIQTWYIFAHPYRGMTHKYIKYINTVGTAMWYWKTVHINWWIETMKIIRRVGSWIGVSVVSLPLFMPYIWCLTANDWLDHGLERKTVFVNSRRGYRGG